MQMVTKLLDQIETPKGITYPLFENEQEIVDENNNYEKSSDKESNPVNSKCGEYERRIVWRNVVAMLLVHSLALYGIYAIGHIKLATVYYIVVIQLLATLGVQAGAHRLWSHRAYKANFGLRLFLALCHVMSLQNDIYEWARDHRGHHKFSDTDADPHNSSRGFFFSHVGWLLVTKHPDVIRRGKTVDLSDLKADPVVRFQRQFYIPLLVIFWAFLPVYIPVYFWGESVWYAITVLIFFRYAYLLNLTWLVNSWSHMYGYRPYNSKIAPVEATIRHLLMGEGFHNYHHAFPWDYSASELGPLDVFNPATASINFFHWMGWAWDLKKANGELVKSKMHSKGNNEEYRYNGISALYEWITGIATLFLPIITIRCSVVYFIGN